MNTNNTSNREASTSCHIVSEYFSHSPVMDKSSMKIKEENQSTSKDLKTKTNKSQKRPRKRAKGQKDIRTLIKKKKNELVSYSKDFELICKQSGIDVDPEQLQLAIALSKSLQDGEAVNNDELKSQKNLTANQRKGKIRITLQEYGFKVKETNSVVKRKRYKKHYKLLLASDSEKQQIIADKYAHILCRNVSINSVRDSNLFKFDNSNNFLYHLSTNVTYKCIKNDDIFYILDLIERSSNERHHMLKDWSTIPGRPASPKIDIPDFNFQSIECSQEELADVLSGTIEVAQNIVKKMYKHNCDTEINPQENKTRSGKSEIHTTVAEFKEKVTKMNSEKSPNKCDFVHFAKEKGTENMTPKTNRSCSPDIFDDEVTIIMDSPKNVVTFTDEVLETTMVRGQNDFMDFTECVNVLNFNNTNSKQNLYLSQGTNKTKINPDDFMELTACVTASSQKILNDIKIVDYNVKDNDNPKNLEDNCRTETMDLTQSSNSDNSVPFPEKDGSVNETLGDDTIIIIDEKYNINAGRNPFTVASAEGDIIDLVSGSYNPNKVPKDNSKHDVLITLEHSSKNNVIASNNFNFESDEQSPGKSRQKDMPISRDLEENKKNEVIEYNRNPESIDLTHAVNFEDLPLSGCSKTSSVDIISSHVSEEDNRVRDLIEDKQNRPKNINCSYNNENSSELNLAKSSRDNKKPKDSPELNDYKYDHIFHDHIDIPISPYRNSQESHIESDNISVKDKNLESMDLTQSSNSEDSVQIVHKDSDEISADRPIFSDEKLVDDNQDDTILVNDDYCANNLINSDLGRHDDIYDVNSTSKTEKLSILDFENDREFDNLLENVSKTKESTTKADDIHIYPDYDYNFRCDNEFKTKNREKYLTQKSNVSGNNPPISEISNNLRNHHEEATCDGQDAEIDLTQHSHYSEDDRDDFRASHELGKVNNVSIDYDEVYVESNNCERYNTFEVSDKNKEKDNFSKDDHRTSSSQNSEIFEISDNEFNYSIHQHKEDNDSIQLNNSRFDIGGISVINEFLNRNSFTNSNNTLRCSCSNLESNSDGLQSCLPEIPLKFNDTNLLSTKDRIKSCTEIESVKISTPLSLKSCNNMLLAQTPTHNDYILKTDQVTPMPKYEIMSSPERNEELDKFGIKPLKRKRAIQILTHIYNQTHPVMEIVSDTEAWSSPSKIQRKDDIATFPRRAIVSQINSVMEEHCTRIPGRSIEVSEPLSQESLKLSKGITKNTKTSPIKTCLSPEYLRNTSIDNISLYKETKEVPDIKDIECSSEEWVFQKREKAKVHSCRVPLHVAFHNYVSCRRGLREAILRYEPINIDEIHKGLVAIGYRYNPKDLLKFMDKKCITVKTADNARNNKK